MQSIEDFGAIKNIWFPHGWVIAPTEENLGGFLSKSCHPPDCPEFIVRLNWYKLPLAGKMRAAFVEALDMTYEELSQGQLASLGYLVEKCDRPKDFDLVAARTGFLKERACLRIEGFSKKLDDQPMQLFLWAVDKNLSICQSLSSTGPRNLFEKHIPEVAFATSSIIWKNNPESLPEA